MKPPQIEGLRPVIALRQREDEFGRLLGSILSPSRPLQSEEFLKGRAEQLDGIRKSLYSPGRHIFIHGFRGVGKSSLAQTAAFQAASHRDPILLGCDHSNNFASVIRDLFEQVANRNPTIVRLTTETSVGFNTTWLSVGGSQTAEEQQVSPPVSVNEAVRLVEFISQNHDGELVVVIDEFDQLEDSSEQEKFANFIKQLSDRHVEAKFIFCGIGENVDELMSAHGSIDRYFHTVPLERLPYEARFEIVESAAARLGIEIDDTTVIRIARISDGFPHYVHLIAEKLFWEVFEAGTGKATGELFEEAMRSASAAMDMKLKRPYELATRKYTNEYEPILFAVADGHELQKRSSDVFESYRRIMESLEQTPIERAKFNQRMNSLKQESHGSILFGTRSGWYEFTEKIIRGYVRLRAEQLGVELEVEHPLALKKLGSKIRIE